MIKIELSHWSRRLLVFFPTHRGVKGFVIHGWDLSNLVYSPYMKNLGEKSHIIIIRDHFITVPEYIGAHIRQNLGIVIYGGVCHIWAVFVISGWDLSYVGGFVIYGYKVIFATISSRYLSI